VGDGIVASLVHPFSVHERKREGLETSMDVHEIKGSDGGGLGDESDVCGDKICSANVIDKDSVVEIVSFREEMVKGVSELGGEDYCFPFGMVSGHVKVSHGVMEASSKVRV